MPSANSMEASPQTLKGAFNFSPRGVCSFFARRQRARKAIEALYAAATAQAKNPEFFKRLGLPDNPNGRFDALVLRLYAIFRLFREEGKIGKRASRRLANIFADDMERCLREIGIGDLGVPRRVRDALSAFYGRLAAYDRGFAALEEG